MARQERTIIILTAAFLVLAAVIVVLVWGGYSNWFQTDFEHIYLTSNGTRLQQSEVYRLGNVKLKVHQFGGKRGFTVKIVPESNEDFVFMVDEEIHHYRNEVEDLTSGFDVEIDGNNFIIHGKKSIGEVLQSMYPDHTVTIPSGSLDYISYRCIVTSSDGKYSFEFVFKSCTRVIDIEVDPDHVYALAGGVSCVS